MGCSSCVPASLLRLSLTSFALCAAVACSACPEASGAGTAGADAPIHLEVSQTFVTVENRTGAILVSGRLEIIQTGILPPFRSRLPRLESGETQNIMLNTFRDRDGTGFSRAVARARRLRLTATDINGREYAQEVPFN